MTGPQLPQFVLGFVEQALIRAGAAEEDVKAELLELVRMSDEEVIMLDVLRAMEEELNADEDVERLDEIPEQIAGRGLVCVKTKLSIAMSIVVVVLVDPSLTLDLTFPIIENNNSESERNPRTRLEASKDVMRAKEAFTDRSRTGAITCKS